MQDRTVVYGEVAVSTGVVGLVVVQFDDEMVYNVGEL